MCSIEGQLISEKEVDVRSLSSLEYKIVLPITSHILCLTGVGESVFQLDVTSVCVYLQHLELLDIKKFLILGKYKVFVKEAQ